MPGVPQDVGRPTRSIVPPNDPDGRRASLGRRSADRLRHPGADRRPFRSGAGARRVPAGPARRRRRGIGRVLIFDEVITGFRVHPGGAQGHYGVTPDLTTLAKVLAGGLPGGCLAGRADILDRPGIPSRQGQDEASRHVQRQSAFCRGRRRRPEDASPMGSRVVGPTRWADWCGRSSTSSSPTAACRGSATASSPASNC